MNGQALGIIETLGFVPAVEAGDVAVKTANVTIIGSQAVGGGLVSILMTGDVSAVKSSVDAGRTAAGRLGEVTSVTVIARTAEGLDGILIEEAKRPKCFPERNSLKPVDNKDESADLKEVVTTSAGCEETVSGAAEKPVSEEPAEDLAEISEEPSHVKDSPDTAPAVKGSGEKELSITAEGETLSFEMAELKKFKVTKLRRLARQLPTFGIPRGEIKFAKKKDLLEAFVQYMKTIEK